ncbi:MAG: aminotransferase class I/II-fold pyridoxal phosphate-dependent enzyme [Candidatus Eremiobacteraeota bacterium]|nr:aminotransferase class I/II-fold pyridoxal phosphate-dependent enzyme [Candidatus Eremiobacteraeota bacterium]MBV9737182.1 aminotransferase class I/II-fold pyridoxal phosphate-dependent enzyme [Candidatus Eremiobacteraeota bacterium]
MTILRATPAIEAIPPMTPFIGPEQLMREGGHPHILRLGANESAFGPSPRAIAAMATELPRLSWYGDPESYELRETLAARLGCKVDEILIGSGIDDLMGLAVRAFVGPGSIALTTRGTYPTFAYHVTGYGGGLETVDYRPDGTIDVDALIERAAELQPGIVYVANPDNPSGTMCTRGQIETLLEKTPPQTLLLLDEAYAEFAPPHSFMSTTIDARLMRVRTFSKAYGMAGARVGYAVTTPRNVETFGKIRLQYGVNRNAQIGALAALADDAYAAGVVGEVERGREEYYALARSLGRKTIPSFTNFVCIDYGSAQEANAVIVDLMARGVFIRKPFAPPLDGYIRVTVGTAPERSEFAEHLRAVRPR